MGQNSWLYYSYQTWPEGFTRVAQVISRPSFARLLHWVVFYLIWTGLATRSIYRSDLGLITMDYIVVAKKAGYCFESTHVKFKDLNLNCRIWTSVLCCTVIQHWTTTKAPSSLYFEGLHGYGYYHSYSVFHNSWSYIWLDF